MAIRTNEDLDPDGVRMVVLWDQLQVTNSFFIPCVNTTKAISQVRSIFKTRGWQARVVITTQDDILGVRIWRTA